MDYREYLSSLLVDIKLFSKTVEPINFITGVLHAPCQHWALSILLITVILVVYVVSSHYCFTLHFLICWWGWTLFYRSAGHWAILFLWSTCSKSYPVFLIGLSFLYLLKFFLYYWKKPFKTYMCCKFFSFSVACLFSILMVSFFNTIIEMWSTILVFPIVVSAF